MHIVYLELNCEYGVDCGALLCYGVYLEAVSCNSVNWGPEGGMGTRRYCRAMSSMPSQ